MPVSGSIPLPPSYLLGFFGSALRSQSTVAPVRGLFLNLPLQVSQTDLLAARGSSTSTIFAETCRCFH